ncbi:MAG: hypothetical protein ACQEXI_00270 [Pseudomonadota bacterium]
MAIDDDRDLVTAVRRAGDLLQEIQDYCGREACDDALAKVRFPRGYIRSADEHRMRLGFVRDQALKSNLSYTLILTDVIDWVVRRTDIFGTAEDMLFKLYIHLGGNMMESVTKDYLRGVRGGGYKVRTKYLCDHGVIDEQLKDEIDWVWDTRNRMHLFTLEEAEFLNDYGEESKRRCVSAFRTLIKSLNDFDRAQLV